MCGLWVNLGSDKETQSFLCHSFHCLIELRKQQNVILLQQLSQHTHALTVKELRFSHDMDLLAEEERDLYYYHQRDLVAQGVTFDRATCASAHGVLAQGIFGCLVTGFKDTIDN